MKKPKAKKRDLTLEEMLSMAVAPIPDVGREFLHLGRDASYLAAKRGDIPTMQLGHARKALIGPLCAKLGLNHRVGKAA